MRRGDLAVLNIEQYVDKVVGHLDPQSVPEDQFPTTHQVDGTVPALGEIAKSYTTLVSGPNVLT